MTEANLYAPPKAEIDVPGAGDAATDVPSYKLYSPGQAALATFLGTPLAGLYLVSRNQQRLGRGTPTTTLLVGFVVTAATFALAFALPDRIGRPLPIASMFAVRAYAQSVTPVGDHKFRRGQMESGWKAAGIGLLGLVVSLAALFLVLMMLPEGMVPD